MNRGSFLAALSAIPFVGSIFRRDSNWRPGRVKVGHIHEWSYANDRLAMVCSGCDTVVEYFPPGRIYHGQRLLMEEMRKRARPLFVNEQTAFYQARKLLG